MKILICLFLIPSVAFSQDKKDTGLVDAINHSNIRQIYPRPEIKLKASLSFKEAVNCDAHPENKKLLVTMNPHSWYALSAVEQINTFCEEMHRCDSRIKCHKL